MNGISWPYLAAMFDGDGSICIGRSRVKGHYEYSLHTPVFNTSLPLMKWLTLHFGGRVRPQSKTSLTRVTCYRWGNYGHEAQARILTNVLPYLVIKKRQAEAALEYLSLHGEKAPEKRELLYQRMKHLNASTSTQEMPDRYKSEDEYLAGILDCEGSICISRPAGYAPRLEIKVSTSDQVLIKWTHRGFGGRYCFRWNWLDRDEYYWYPSGRKNKETLLLQLIPHLLVKREQAKLALQFLRTGDASLADTITSLNNGNSPTTNTQDCSETEQKIESELHGDVQSALVVTQAP